jgi:penicillin-binding protein 1C
MLKEFFQNRIKNFSSLIRRKSPKNIFKWLLKSKFAYSILFFVLFVFLLDRLFPLPVLKPCSKVIYTSDGSMLTAYLSKDDKWRMKVHLNEVSPDLIKSIIEKEDGWFYWHPGINPISILRAAYQNITRSKRISGASTITMQVARMLQPAQRTYTNKFVEMLRAVQLELHFSKDEILELYLTLLPYGGNIEGVKSASYIYFNRPPGKLSLSQSILLTVIPNNPNDLRLDKFSKRTITIRNKWLRIFSEGNIFDKEALRDAFDEPVNVNRYPIKNEAPHFCRFVSKKYEKTEVYTSLNSSIQQTAEKLLSNYVNKLKSKDICNGAAIIINNKTNSISGYCGSNDYDDTSSYGQVNGIIALRSPGSSLKPALYAQAFDFGILTPSMRVMDIPTDFNGYEPENFDLKYKGYVTASYALVNSLNIPAVQLLQQTGTDKFISLLEKAGLSDIAKNKNSLGLSLILGGCGVRLEQLVQLYTAFAHDGKLYKLNYLKTNSLDESNSSKLFSPGAAYLISTILTSNERPDFPRDFIYSTNLPNIAWKTGTSFGKRDAWAIGYNPNYTIGVWLGNFNGKGSPDLTGAGIAVPLLFELFNSIDYKPKNIWFDRPDDVLERAVCTETGLLPTENCSHLKNDFYIKNISPNQKCNLYKSLYVDKNESIHYCPECLPDSGYKKAVYPFYNSELTLWYIKNKIDFKRPPPHNPLCQLRHSGDGPKIISPLENYEYYLEADAKQQVLLQAASDPSVKIQYWYIDNKFYKKSRPGDKLFFTPSPGITKIACLDDLGRKESINLKVIFF